jgi:hypothetical protein
VIVAGESIGLGGSYDGVTIKYSSAGVPLWTNRYNGPGDGDDYEWRMALDGDGNVIVAGESHGSGSDWDYVTIKYSSDGIPLWTNRYNGPSNADDILTALAIDAGNNVIVTGQSTGAAGPGGFATIKYSSEGIPLWTNRYNGPGNADDSPSALALDAGDNVIVTGESIGLGGNYDGVTIKYSSAGVPLWTNRYNGPGNGDDYGWKIALDGDGNVIVTGESQGDGSSSDYVTIKYWADGVPRITVQPASRMNLAGTTASFMVAATGTEPLSYQWRKSGMNLTDGGRLLGVTTTNLSVASVEISDTGDYTVVVTNPFGSVTSEVAVLTVTLGEDLLCTAFPIATNGTGDMAFGAAYDGANYLVAIQANGFSPGSISAQRISQNAELVGPRIETGQIGTMPHAAFDGVNYLMVWAGSVSKPGFHGQFISPNGSLVGPLLTIDPETPRETSLACGAGKYLACWSDEETLWGRLITPAGQFEGGRFAISGAIDQTRNSAIAFNGTNFFVAFNGSGDLLTNIYGRFVSPLGALASTNIIIDGTPDPSDNPVAVAFDGRNFFVVFNDQVGGIETGTMRVFGRFVDASGAVLPGRHPVGSGTNAQALVSVAFDGAHFLVGWSIGTSFDNLNLVLQFLNRDGQPVGPVFAALPAQGERLPLFGAPLFDGNRFMVSASLWPGDVYGVFLPASTAPPQMRIIRPLAHGECPLALIGTPGINYAIEVSTNLGLPHWTVLTTNSPINGTFFFVDPAATNVTRFYRAVRQ